MILQGTQVYKTVTQGQKWHRACLSVCYMGSHKYPRSHLRYDLTEKTNIPTFHTRGKYKTTIMTWWHTVMGLVESELYSQSRLPKVPHNTKEGVFIFCTKYN